MFGGNNVFISYGGGCDFMSKTKFPVYCKDCEKSFFPALFSAHCKKKNCGVFK